MPLSLPATGGCACGLIRYDCSVEPLFMFFCRCRDCQRATGGPYAANVWFPITDINFGNGELQSYISQGQSGQATYHDFCQNCGSPIGMRTDGFADIRGIRAAGLDDPSGLKPTAIVWMCNALPWDIPESSLPRSESNLSQAELDASAEQ